MASIFHMIISCFGKPDVSHKKSKSETILWIRYHDIDYTIYDRHTGIELCGLQIEQYKPSMHKLQIHDQSYNH